MRVTAPPGRGCANLTTLYFDEARIPPSTSSLRLSRSRRHAAVSVPRAPSATFATKFRVFPCIGTAVATLIVIVIVIVIVIGTTLLPVPMQV